METREGLHSEKLIATDRDLSALEAWVLSSSHVISTKKGAVAGNQKALEGLFNSDERNLILTPYNVLNGKYTPEEETTIRGSRPYTSGALVVFGPDFVFGVDHKILLGELGSDGTVSQMIIQLLQSGSLIDPRSLGLKLDPSYRKFFHEPEFLGDNIALRVKQK